MFAPAFFMVLIYSVILLIAQVRDVYAVDVRKVYAVDVWIYKMTIGRRLGPRGTYEPVSCVPIELKSN